MKKTQITDKNTQKPRRHRKNPDLVEKPSCGNTDHSAQVRASAVYISLAGECARTR